MGYFQRLLKGLGSADARGDPAVRRSQRIKYAVVTSLASKLFTIGIQVLAMPLAIHALGPKSFALYAMLSSALMWLSLANIGMGPRVAIEIADAEVHGDQARQSRLMTGAVVPISALIVVLFFLLLIVAKVIGIENVFGKNYQDQASVISTCLLLLASFALMQALLSVIEAVQSGFQEQYKLNSWMILGNIVTLISLLVVSRVSPTIVGFILAVNGPGLLARLANSAFLFFKRAHLAPRLSFYSWRDSRPLIFSGIAFSLTSLASFINHQLPIVLVGRVVEPQQAAYFAAAMNMFMISIGPISMFSVPFWPAVSDSLARGDLTWATRAFRKLVRYSVGYSLIVALGFGFAGVPIFRIWFGANARPHAIPLVLMGIYAMFAIWEYVHFTFLVGLNRIGLASGLYGLRSVLCLAGILMALRSWGVVGVCASLCASVLISTGWAYPRLVEKNILRIGEGLRSLRPAPDH